MQYQAGLNPECLMKISDKTANFQQSDLGSCKSTKAARHVFKELTIYQTPHLSNLKAFAVLSQVCATQKLRFVF